MPLQNRPPASLCSSSSYDRHLPVSSPNRTERSDLRARNLSPCLPALPAEAHRKTYTIWTISYSFRGNRISLILPVCLSLSYSLSVFLCVYFSRRDAAAYAASLARRHLLLLLMLLRAIFRGIFALTTLLYELFFQPSHHSSLGVRQFRHKIAPGTGHTVPVLWIITHCMHKVHAVLIRRKRANTHTRGGYVGTKRIMRSPRTLPPPPPRAWDNASAR